MNILVLWDNMLVMKGLANRLIQKTGHTTVGIVLLESCNIIFDPQRLRESLYIGHKVQVCRVVDRGRFLSFKNPEELHHNLSLN